MKEKKSNYNYLIFCILALVSSSVAFCFNVEAFFLLPHIGSYSPIGVAYLIVQILIAFAAFIFIVINIIKLVCKKSAGAFGLACIIFAVAAELLLFILRIAESLSWGVFIFPTLQFAALAVCSGLLAGYLVCLKKFPVPKDEANGQSHESSGFISIGMHIAFMILFGFIWQYAWIFRTVKYINSRVDEKRNPTGAVLLCMFVPFYIIYWIYKTAQAVDNIANSAGIICDIKMLCLVVELFIPIIPPIIIQQKINEIHMSNSAEKKESAFSAGTVSDDLKKYKELLDAGAITTEEYEKIKEKYLSAI